MANFDFSTKPEVVFKIFKNGDRYTLAILQSPYMPNFKSLSCLLIDTRTLGLLAFDGVFTVVFPEIDSHEVSIIASTKLCYHADEAI